MVQTEFLPRLVESTGCPSWFPDMLGTEDPLPTGSPTVVVHDHGKVLPVLCCWDVQQLDVVDEGVP